MYNKSSKKVLWSFCVIVVFFFKHYYYCVTVLIFASNGIEEQKLVSRFHKYILLLGVRKLKQAYVRLVESEPSSDWNVLFLSFPASYLSCGVSEIYSVLEHKHVLPS